MRSKRKIRAEVLKRRNSLSQKELHEKSLAIKERLMALPEFKKAKTILFYISFQSEVQTHALIKEQLNRKKIVVPKVDKKDIILSELKDFKDLEKNSFGILEPKKINKADPKDIGLAIIPGIAFDNKCSRIGFGYGYYDKLLKKITVPKIALAFELQIIGSITATKNDVKVDKIVTEKRIIAPQHF